MKLNKIKENLLDKVNVILKNDNNASLFSVKNKYYFCNYEDNLIYKTNNRYQILYDDILHELDDGNGKELNRKFRAIYSSSALCVNSFAFFKRQKTINIPFLNGLILNGTLKFESKLPTGVSPAKANLDLEINSNDTIVFIESKFLEYYSKVKKLNISKKYDKMPNIKLLIDKYKDIKDKNNMDCVKQLICHFAAINHHFKTGRFQDKKIYLCFLYWSCGESSDEEENLIKILKDLEINLKDKDINHNNIKFIYGTYNELYKLWGNSTTLDLKEHAKKLKERYIIPV